jgi:hypothetical protein
LDNPQGASRSFDKSVLHMKVYSKKLRLFFTLNFEAIKTRKEQSIYQLGSGSIIATIVCGRINEVHAEAGDWQFQLFLKTFTGVPEIEH